MFRGAESRFPSGMAGRLFGGVCLAALAALAQPAMAQTTPQPPAAAQPADQDSSGAGIGDIVVTARYVSENLQNTPMAITAQSAPQLEAAGVTNISSLGAVVPNLYTIPGDPQSAVTPVIKMRGVSQGASSSLASPPAVAIYMDDVYQATTAGSELDMTDVDHLEVNRGPQSTLSGNASIGGSVQIYTRNPTGDGSGYLEVTGGSYDKWGAQGAMDMALTDTLAMRVSADFIHQDGFVDRLDFTCEMIKQGTPQLAGTYPEQPDAQDHNCITGTLGGINHVTGQVKLRWRPNDRLDVLLTGRVHRENDGETPEVALAYIANPNPNSNTVTQGFNNATQAAYGIQLGPQFLTPPSFGGYATYSTDCRPDYSATQPNTSATPSGFCYPQGKTAYKTTVSLKTLYKVTDNINMTAIAAYSGYSNEFSQNGDQSPLGYVVSHFENRDYQGTGELRFNGTLFDDKLAWTVGGFLLRLKGYQDTFAGVDFAGTSYAHDSAQVDSQSGFFHLDYNITSRWRISGGARYTNGSIDYTLNHPGQIVLAAPFDSKESRVDWLVSTDYRITDNIMAYANAASGSRPPGLTTVVSTAAQFLPTPAEELISYDAGLKIEAFDHRLRADLSAFFTDYSKLATSQGGYQCIGQPGTPTWFPTSASCAQFSNGGYFLWYIPIGISAKITGFEWDITARPIEHLLLDWTGGYNHYESGVTTPGAVGYLWPGNHVQPDWNMHADVGYDIVGSFGTITPRIDWSWQSQQDFDPASNVRAPLPIYILHPFSIFNAQLVYKNPKSDWSATLAVDNLANKFYYYAVLQGSLDAQTRLAPPREVSVTLRRNF